MCSPRSRRRRFPQMSMACAFERGPILECPAATVIVQARPSWSQERSSGLIDSARIRKVSGQKDKAQDQQRKMGGTKTFSRRDGVSRIHWPDRLSRVPTNLWSGSRCNSATELESQSHTTKIMRPQRLQHWCERLGLSSNEQDDFAELVAGFEVFSGAAGIPPWKAAGHGRQTPVIQCASASQTLVPPPKIARGTKATKARVPQM